MKKLFFLLLCFKGLSQEAVNFSLYYDTDVYELTEQQKNTINNRFALLNKKDVLMIEVIAYADYVDTKTYNKLLSKNRAEKAYKHLSSVLDTNEIKVLKEAYGEEFSEQKKDLKGYAKDRRVDISIHFKSPYKLPKDSLLLGYPVKDITIGTKIPLDNLYFFRGRTKMYDYSTDILDSLGAFMQRNTSYKFEIQGHVCCGGEDPGDVVNIDTKTKTLSIDRARAIYEYLTKKMKIDSNRVNHKGFGFSQPKITPEKTIHDEKNNRRVEILIKDF